MRKLGLYRRMLGTLLGMQVLCYLPAYSGGAFANAPGRVPPGGTLDGPVRRSPDGSPGRLAVMATITGTITDNNGNPIAGVSVTVKGTRRGDKS